ncbi:MAG: 2-C-methyl-D-erythritol 2,4-cyclodiphosphate synthase [Actinobacteria bacterium]|nr:2-C-methyl-D-erythritol 2,4-cyclodiphosphate synthase [Actinomycetota bacterium]
MLKVGLGFDVHRFTRGRDLVIGGVRIPNEEGLLGHSDADVLVHAIMDALLGSFSEKDIGQHFPNTDKEFENISSIELLSRVGKILQKAGRKIVNIDSVILLESPKVSPHSDEMRENIARALGINKDDVSIKATTSEGLGYVGRGEGAACYAVAMTESVDK